MYSQKDLGYELNIGDIIKIGRFKIKVRKLNLKNKKNNKKDKNEKVTLIINDNEFNNGNKICRICF